MEMNELIGTALRTTVGFAFSSGFGLVGTVVARRWRNKLKNAKN